MWCHSIGGAKVDPRVLSDPHKGHIDTFRTYINDFHGFLRELGETYNPKSTIFMAHSMGGNIMTRYTSAIQTPPLDLS